MSEFWKEEINSFELLFVRFIVCGIEFEINFGVCK
jgi:hypothetical protein